MGEPSLRDQIASTIAWLKRQKVGGHCGEGLADIKAREDHNERIDRIILALLHPTDG